MNFDDVIYLSLLLASIAIGYLWNFVRDKNTRKLCTTAIGLLIVVLVSGIHILHMFILVIMNAVILMACSKSSCHYISFAISFIYLFLFRICYLFGMPSSPTHSNAVQMVMTLKVVGLCFEVHDTWRRKGELKKMDDQEKKSDLALELKYDEVNPSLIDLFCYSFCYIGVLTGPYYKYRSYEDFINGSTLGHVDCTKAMLARLKFFPLYAALFLLSSFYFPLSFAESDVIFTKYSFMYRIWYMMPLFFTFRMRIYSGFVLSECVCIMAGLGAYPAISEPRPGKGPTKYNELEKIEPHEMLYNFETIHNIDEWGSEFAPSVRGGMRSWNMTVQYWLASNVYKRLRFSKSIKEALTMLASAYWHGVYAGYYLSMLTVPFILAVEDYYDKLIRRKCGDMGKKIYDFIFWFLKMQHFSYMGLAFLLLRVDVILNYWKSVGFIYHGLILLMHVFGQYINLIFFKAEKKLKKYQQTICMGDTKIKVVRSSNSKKRVHTIEDSDLVHL